MNRALEERFKKWKKDLIPGKPYRRKELENLSTNLSRDLDEFIKGGFLNRPSPGIYFWSEEKWFGKDPVDTQKLLKCFLKSNDFLVVDFNKYNSLGLGTTQLYNKIVVYNHKRHGKFPLGGMEFEFKKVPYVYRKLDKEFLLVDLLNNLKFLGEDVQRIKESVKKRLNDFNFEKVLQLAKKYGKVATKKFLEDLSVPA